MLSTEVKEKLVANGFFVEDMGKEYGAEFEGQYRWTNRITGDFQDHETSDSESEAWEDAAEFFEEVDALDLRDVNAWLSALHNVTLNEEMSAEVRFGWMSKYIKANDHNNAP